MLHHALDAFVNHDLVAAQNIPAEDDVLDSLYNEINREMIGMVIKNSNLIDRANYLTWVAHNLERAGDRVTNISNGSCTRSRGTWSSSTPRNRSSAGSLASYAPSIHERSNRR